MSITVEELARKEWEAMQDPTRVRVRIGVKWFGSICLPCSLKDCKEEHEAVFKTLTYGDNALIEKVCTYEGEIERGIKKNQVDVIEMRRLIVKRNLLEWTLPIKIEREEGWMCPESYEKISLVPAPLMDAFLDEFESRCSVSSKDEQMISRQATVLFGKNSSGVADACEAVSLFCTYGNYSEKFGIDRESLIGLPYREYLMLKMMVNHENKATAQQQTQSRSTSHTKIAGMGSSRIRPSRGVSVPGTG